ncbi:MAG TPA: succinic semialdehyde dehydrogenase [Candidatus Lustribacter sp.]|nr:succinic semialdehyde dehydrogenase [Candidatus Lustribacter sp.]
MASETLVDPELDPSATFAVDPALVRRLTARVVCGPRPERVVTHSPLTGAPVANLPRSTPADVAVAYETAQAAQRRWCRTPVSARAAVLLRLHDIVLARQPEILDLIQLESGKARVHAFEEVADVAIASRHYGRVGPRLLRPHRRAGLAPLLTQTVESHLPIGVVGIVSPWNYPFSLAVTDALPALLAGNAVLLRPDVLTSLCALMGAELLAEAGLPDGVLQIVLGAGSTVGQAVLDRADYVCYTGSTAVGRSVAQRAAMRLVGASLELGGKNSLYVRADADLDRAVLGITRSAFSSAGQLCMHTERVVVDASVADELLAKLVPAVEAMRLGAELAFGPDMGSLMSKSQLTRVTEHVEDARAKGARVLAGGRPRPELGPYFYEPTLLEGVTPAMSCSGEETFGPVVAIYRVSGDDEALALMNDTEYGLHASIFSRDVRGARSLARRVRTGTVSINEGYLVTWGSVAAPLGGMKQSGIGRRHGAEGLLRFTEPQNVSAQHGPMIGPIGSMSQEQFAAGLTKALRAMKALGRP